MSAPLTTTGNLRTVTFRVTLVLLLCAGAVAIVVWRVQHRQRVTIGVEGSRIVEIDGPRLIAAPFTPGDALSVRIASAQPTASGFRYDLRYMAFGPGEHDIGKSLVDPSGNLSTPRPDVKVSVPALIPEKYSGELYATPNSAIDLHTNYSLLMTFAWGLWAFLFVPLIWYGRQWRGQTAPAKPEPSIAAQLRSVLLRATAKDLTAEEQADLEQLLLAFWSQRLNLSQERLSETIQQLRRHPQAGPQWTSVERWFHARATPGSNLAAKQLLQDLESLN